jgi:hypothetical protein
MKFHSFALGADYFRLIPLARGRKRIVLGPLLSRLSIDCRGRELKSFRRVAGRVCSISSWGRHRPLSEQYLQLRSITLFPKLQQRQQKP